MPTMWIQRSQPFLATRSLAGLERLASHIQQTETRVAWVPVHSWGARCNAALGRCEKQNQVGALTTQSRFPGSCWRWFGKSLCDLAIPWDSYTHIPPNGLGTSCNYTDLVTYELGMGAAIPLTNFPNFFFCFLHQLFLLSLFICMFAILSSELLLECWPQHNGSISTSPRSQEGCPPESIHFSRNFGPSSRPSTPFLQVPGAHPCQQHHGLRVQS